MRYDTRIGFSSFVGGGRVAVDVLWGDDEIFRDFIDDAALLADVFGRISGIRGAASVTSQLHYNMNLVKDVSSALK